MTGVGRVPRGEAIRQGLTDAIVDVGMAERMAAINHDADQRIAAINADADAKVAEIEQKIAGLKTSIDGYYVQVLAEEWATVTAEACSYKLEKLHRAITRMLADAEAENLPSGARPSWRRGTWA